LIEIAGPAAQQRVQLDHSLLDRKRVPPSRRLVVNSLDDPLKRLARRLGADERLAVLSVKSSHGVPEEVEGLLWHARDPGLPFIDGQTQPFHQPPHRRERLRPVAGSAADHEIIGIVDDVRIESPIVTVLVPCPQESPEVEVSEERRCRSPLWSPSLPVASLRCAQCRAPVRALPHRYRQPALEDRQDLPVVHAPRDAPQQRTMRDCGEVVGQIRIHHFSPVMLRNVKVHSPHSRLRIPSGPEPILLRGKVRFEDRTEHEHDGGLDHAILHRRDTQRPLATIAFWNPHTQKRLRCIALAPQFLLQRYEPPVYACGLDRFEVDPIHPRCAGISPAAPKCFEEYVFAIDLVPQAVESAARFGLGFRL